MSNKLVNANFFIGLIIQNFTKKLQKLLLELETYSVGLYHFENKIKLKLVTPSEVSTARRGFGLGWVIFLYRFIVGIYIIVVAYSP